MSKGTMTEAEWLTTDDPGLMLGSLSGKPSDRKARLFGCACCYRARRLMIDESCYRALDKLQLFVEGDLGEDDFPERECEAWEDVRDIAPVAAGRRSISAWLLAGAASDACAYGGVPNSWDWVRLTAWEAAGGVVMEGRGWDDPHWDRILREAWGYYAGGVQDSTWARTKEEEAFHLGEWSFSKFPGWAEERARQADLLREVVGNPFRPAEIQPGWLSWNEGVILKLARSAYEENDFSRVPILGDALEEAGCSEQALLDHCRQGGEHFLGCWVLEALLGTSGTTRRQPG